ncbi:hypothetical protein [Lysinibacillus capsici]|uniref:hypothetical protein n=1 Tax=Lysinibacillus capsici TaxID=2115968 RepID=UPI0030821A15|nr:hypothetical protein ICJ70_13295 [Lysinibacillus capsici]
MSQVFSNDTARLLVEFKDYQGGTIFPINVTLTIYDELEQVVKTVQSSQIKQDSNKYFYDYTHETESNYVFEFKGTYEGYPVLCRQFVKVVFV